MPTTPPDRHRDPEKPEMVAELAQLHSPLNPLHPSVKNRLHPEYVAFYDKYLVNAQQVHHLPVHVARISGGPPPSHSKPLAVGGIQDVSISRRETSGPNIPLRCFTPPAVPPRSGWPLVLYYHGGGWVFGDIDTENTGQSRLNLDLTKVAISGASAGANIAAVIAQKAVLRPQAGVSLRSQVLVVPPTDNTALPCTSSSWKEFEFTAHLPAKKMLWYRHHYLPNSADWSHLEASPLLAPDDVFKLLPRSYIIVGELDVLRHDGEEYARKLKANGVPTEVHVAEGMPHPFLAMDAVLEAGRTAITNICDELVQAFA
ncbi:hypothetical protein H2200_011332 [Cladophialophora chaetospira]|uniref:Alpha/beta hydrolase fold-3 domain-containing protein n=1 Tax=Cladophialophora chaetospira TaxID=386627 RepID=A0AA38X0F6_9EURO|nr:hypothetical protein H2200_011332 [Cladophialophora chaetospira]